MNKNRRRSCEGEPESTESRIQGERRIQGPGLRQIERVRNVRRTAHDRSKGRRTDPRSRRRVGGQHTRIGCRRHRRTQHHRSVGHAQTQRSTGRRKIESKPAQPAHIDTGRCRQLVHLQEKSTVIPEPDVQGQLARHLHARRRCKRSTKNRPGNVLQGPVHRRRGNINIDVPPEGGSPECAIMSQHPVHCNRESRNVRSVP